MTIQRRTIAGLAALLLMATAGPGTAQESNNEEAQPQATRQAQAVSRSVYEVIEKSRVLIDEEKLVQFDALSHYNRYTDIFDYEDVPEKERKK